MASFEWPPSGGGSNEFTKVILDGSVSGQLTLEAAATTTDYTIVFPPAQGGTGTTLVNDGSGNLSWDSAADITIGAFGSTPNANGLTLTGDVLNMQPADDTHPGGVSITTQSFAGNKTFTGTISASNLSGTNSGDVTLTAVGSSPNADGASLSTQVLTLQPANTSFPGVLLAADWNTFNSKQATGNYATSGSGDVTWSAPSGAGPVTTTLTATTNGTLATLSALTTASSLATVGTITSGTWAGTTVAVNHGGTGQVTAAAAFNALSPITTTGDMIYSPSGATSQRLPIGSSGNVLTVSGGVPAWAPGNIGTVTLVTFTGDGTVLSSTPSSAVTTTGTVPATLATAAKNTYLGGPLSGSAAAPTYKTFTPPTIQKFTSTGTTTGYLFTISTSTTCAAGDTYTNNGHTYTVLAALSAQSGNVFFTSGVDAPTASGTLTRATGSGTSSISFGGSNTLATYTPPTNPAPLYLRVRAIGAGGGGQGSGGSPGAGGQGGETAFGALLIASTGGTGGNGDGGNGGTGSLGTGPIGIVGTGNGGGGAGNTTASTVALGGAAGGGSAIGGGGHGGNNGGGGGQAGATNSGGGGGGAGVGASAGISGAGGGGGGFVDAIVTSPTATVYCIGAGGLSGTLGSGGAAGGAGAAGLIEVTEYYQ